MGDLPDGGVIGWGDYVLPNEYRKKSSACGTIPIEQLLNTGRGPQTFRKSNQSPWNEVGQKIKTTGRQRWDLCPREGVLKVEKFPHTRKPAHRRGQGELRNLRGGCSRSSEDKRERIQHRDFCWPALPAEKQFSCPLQQVGVGCWGSGFRNRTPRWGLGLPALKLL